MGFMGRADFRAVSTNIGYQDFTAGKHFRNFGAYAYSNHTWNFGGNSIFQSIAGGAFGTFNNQSSFSFGAGYNPRYLNDRFTRGGPLSAQPANFTVYANAGSDTRKVISLRGFASHSHAASGTGWDLGTTADYRPASNLRLTFGPSLSRQNSTAQYVRSVTDAAATTTFGKRYVFAALHQTTLVLDTRAEWTFTPALSFQLYAQPFVSAGQYHGYKEFLQPRQFKFAKYGVEKGTIARASSGTYTVDPDGAGPATSFQFGDPMFNVRNLRGNAVVRWEYRPGSALFFVWQQQRHGFEPIGDFSAGRDVGEIFRSVPTNVFLIKATYWIGR